MSDSTVPPNVAQGNVGAAFGLVIGAGLATALGASVVFFPSLVKLASRRVLASGLGFSAGVMIYVSFVEIFFKSLTAFADGGMNDLESYAYTTLCFFGGVLTMIFIDLVLRCFSKGHHHHDPPDLTHVANEVDDNPEETAELKKDDFEVDAETGNGDTHADGQAHEDIPCAPHCIGCSENPGAELEEWQRRAREEEEEAHRFADDGATAEESASATAAGPAAGEASAATTSDGKGPESNTETDQKKPISIYRNKNKPTLIDEENPEKVAESVEVVDSPTKEAGDEVSDVSENQQNADRHENKKLINMGINTAVAIGIHNFPEGLATFVAALGDVRVGAVLAVAIGVHNVPEGLCVAMPIYYATGNRWKAFGWGLLSGISEPIAALLGWLVLANVFSDFTYAVLFGLVSGMMVVISVKELLPTAHRYDDSDGVVTYSFIVGMMVMALSLVLFYV